MEEIMEGIEEKEMPKLNVHHGHNIYRTRKSLDMKQEVLAQTLRLSQPMVSRYENARVIDDAMLVRFADALNVPVKFLKNMEDDAQTVVFENITNNESAGSLANIGYNNNTDNTDNIDNRVINNNPIDKITELYERLLKEKDEKYAALERRLRSVEESLQK